MLRAAGLFGTLLVASAITGCVPPEPVSPVAPAPVSAGAFAAALRAEMTTPDDPTPYLEAIDRAASAPGDPDALAVVAASLEALVERAPGTPSRIGTPIAKRTREGFQKVVLRLRQSWESLEGSTEKNAPLIRVQIARALHEMALFTGEKRGANVWFARRGCVASATVVGPLDEAPLTSLDEPAVVSAHSPLEASYPGLSRFAPATVVPVPSDACRIDADSTTRFNGLREIVVDVEVPQAQRVSLAFTTTAAATVEVGGVRVLDRRYEEGGLATTSMGSVQVTEGTVRVVVRLADKGDADDIELDIVGADGLRLASRAPVAGDLAKAKATLPAQISFARDGATDEQIAAISAGLLATGHARRAERVVEASLLEKREGRDPMVMLLWMRAMEMAGDMSDQKRQERMRSAVEELRRVAPDAWEPRLAAAELSQRRKGAGAGTFEALADLGVATPTSDLSAISSVELAFVIGVASQANLDDIAESAYAALAKRTPGSSLVAQLDTMVHPRSGRDWMKVACDGGLERSSTRCAMARNAVGDRREALAEIARLRELRSAPSAELDLELMVRTQMGDDAGAIAAYDAMLPGERSLMAILPILARSKDKSAAEARVRHEATLTRDGTYALARAAAAFGAPSVDAKRYEDQGRKIVLGDRSAPALPGAATAVLKHVEHYGIDDSGLVRVFLYDLRRVSGTTDVERGIHVESPFVEGRGTSSALRRRVHKKDGRVLEPDQAQFAMQGGSDLSQLEQGDYVEHVIEGYYLPSESGDLTIDTPDLLPERTSVVSADVVIRMPEWMDVSFWSHPMLGKPKTESKMGYKFLSFAVRDQAPRRIEDGLPWLERGVRVSLGTHTWAEVGRAVGESIRGLEETDPFMTRFAGEITASSSGAPPDADQASLVARVVEHVGRVIKVSGGGGEIGDFGSYYGGGAQGQTARPMIEEGVGSRTWVVYRTLRELGVEAEIAVAETEPFSGSPGFPPHPGRFKKPLVVAHLDGRDLWVDADVDGPPLPPGRVSPELRGRSAILGDGTIVAVPVLADDAVDEVSLDIELDAAGTARGAATVVLRGQQAQALSESFFHVVGDDRREMLRSVVQGWVPWASVDEVKLASKEGAWEVRLEAKVTIPGFGSAEGRDGKSWVLPGYTPARGATLAQRYGSHSARQSALTIDNAVQYKVSRRIKLPAGATVSKLPGPVDRKSATISAQRVISQDAAGPGVITETFTMSLPTGTVSADAYRGFLDDMQTIDAGFLAGIRVRIKP